MPKFQYYSSFWAMWYSEENYNNLIDDINTLKDLFKKLIRSETDEM